MLENISGTAFMSEVIVMARMLNDEKKNVIPMLREVNSLIDTPGFDGFYRIIYTEAYKAEDKHPLDDYLRNVKIVVKKEETYKCSYKILYSNSTATLGNKVIVADDSGMYNMVESRDADYDKEANYIILEEVEYLNMNGLKIIARKILLYDGTNQG